MYYSCSLWYELCFGEWRGASRDASRSRLEVALVDFNSIDGVHMWGKLFPERIFARRMNRDAEKRLRLAQARAEESMVRAHVDNAMMFVDTLSEDLPFDRAIETYVRVMGIPEPLASTVATRSLVTLGEEMMPYRSRLSEAQKLDEAAAGRPPLRLDQASDAQVRVVRRA